MIKNSGKVIVKADKTRNFYAVTPKFYSEVMEHNIGKDYGEANPDELKEANHKAAELVKRWASRTEQKSSSRSKLSRPTRTRNRGFQLQQRQRRSRSG